MKVKFIDPRNKKHYVGVLSTINLVVGKHFIIPLIDGKHEFMVSKIKGYLHCENVYWLIDAHGVKFKLILKHDPVETKINSDSPQ